MFSKLSHTFHSQINTVLVISRKSVMIIFHFLSPAHSDPDALKMFLQEVASVAPTLPFYYYHIPAITGVNGWCHWRWIFVFHSHEHLRRHVGRQIIFTECEMCFFFFSAGERYAWRYWDAHSLLSRCEVQRDWPDGPWPVCQLQSASLVAPLRRGRSQHFLPLSRL